MKIVREHINFEKGEDPRSVLGLASKKVSEMTLEEDEQNLKDAFDDVANFGILYKGRQFDIQFPYHTDTDLIHWQAYYNPFGYDFKLDTKNGKLTITYDHASYEPNSAQPYPDKEILLEKNVDYEREVYEILEEFVKDEMLQHKI